MNLPDRDLALVESASKRGKGAHRRPGDPPLEPSSAPEKMLSAGIWRLSNRAREGGLTFEEILRESELSSPHLFCALLALPFCQPVPTVGLSMPFGLGVAFFGVAMLFERRPKVPSWLGRRQIPSHVFPALLRVTADLIRRAERVLRRRAEWMLLPPLTRIWAIALIVDAVCLSLPLPVPFSNAFPAASIVAICMGSLKRDGVAVAIGIAAFVVALSFIIGIGVAGVASLPLMD